MPGGRSRGGGQARYPRKSGVVETGAITAIIGLLSLIAGGVLTFAREVVKAERTDKEWWRDKGFVILESQQETLEAEVKKDEGRDAKVCQIIELLQKEDGKGRNGDE